MSNLNEQLRELKWLAEAATPGPWERGGGDGGGCQLHVYGEDLAGAAVCGMDNQHNFTPRYRRIANLDYIAAANPSTILSLIAELESRSAPAAPQATSDARDAVIRAALESCKKYSSQDIDGDWITRRTYDDELVEAALATLGAGKGGAA